MSINEKIQLARKHHFAGNLEQAEYIYREILDIQPLNSHVYNDLGDLLQKKGCPDEALVCYKKAIKINPAFASAYHNLGEIYQDKGQLDEALNCYKKAIELNPDFAGPYYNLAVILQKKGQLDEAVTYFYNVLALSPNDADSYNYIGTIFERKGLFDEAIKYYHKAMQSNPCLEDAYNNLGFVYKYLGQLDKAIKYYRKAVQLSPNNAEIHFGMSLTLLLSGNFQSGWNEYEWRWGTEDFVPYIRNFPQPSWNGTPLKGKKLFITQEQGVGDEIMFVSCLPDVISRADLCVVECDRRLVPLFSRSFPKALVIERLKSGDSYPSGLHPVDMNIAMGSLPKFFRRNLTDFPQQKAYLIPNAQKVDLWRQRYRALGDSLKVGISWRGGSNPEVILRRSIKLEQWSQLFSVSKVHFINLQYGDCVQELHEAQEMFQAVIHDWEDTDPLEDLDWFAAQISALDLVISVDNATVHMAGALGIPVWTLLPFACDWRWMREYEDTPWYKTVRLFRQRSQGDWNNVFKRVAANLMHYISTGLMPEIPPGHSYKSNIKV